MPQAGDTIGVITRRALLKNAGTAFLTYTLARTGLHFKKEDIRIVEETRIIMGSPSTITVVGEDRKKLKTYVDAAFQEMKRLEGLMTIYDDKSEISRLNAEGSARLSNECIDVLKRSLYFSRFTRGAFDITPGYYRDLDIRTDAASFKRADMSVDLGGIGIGYAVDRAIDILMSKGLRSALVDGGGEIKALGRKTNDLLWKIGIRDPFRRDRFIDIINLDDLSVSTSGNYEKKHIIDPKTGSFPKTLVSATIISKEAVTADALSTAVFVMGVEKGLSLIEKTQGVEGLLVTTDRKIIRSPGFSRLIA